MRKISTRTVRGVRIESDDIVIALIDLLIKGDARMEAMQSELNEHMEMIAELQPKLMPDGRVSLRVMTSDETPKELNALVSPSAVLELESSK